MPKFKKAPVALFMLALACATTLLVAAGLSEQDAQMESWVSSADSIATPSATKNTAGN